MHITSKNYMLPGVLSLCLVGNVASLASCPPPRFDNFLDSILGPWSAASTGTGTDVGASDVEEVMRSCGGAVQGVKEISYPGSTVDNMYHNRADDGFLFFNCGSYSSGPTSIPPDCDQNDIGATSFVSSLSFLLPPLSLSPSPSPSSSSSLKSRIRIIITTLPKFSLFLRKKRFSISDNQDEGDLSEDIQLTSIDDHPPRNIWWEEEILCRMSSSTQPWMLQRASWEKFINENVHEVTGENNGIDTDNSNGNSNGNNNNNKIDEPITEKIQSPRTWIRSCEFSPEASSTSTKALWQSKELITLFRSNNVSKMIQIGALIDHNNSSSGSVAKAFLRCYDSNGNLKAVIMQSGMSL